MVTRTQDRYNHHIRQAGRIARDRDTLHPADYVNEFFDVEHIRWAPTRKGNARWIATAKCPGFPAQIELWPEHVARINKVLGPVIQEGQDCLVDFMAIPERWSARRGFVGVVAIEYDYVIHYAYELDAVEVEPSLSPWQAMTAAEDALRYAAYTLKRHIASITPTSARERLAGHPAGLRVELTPGGDAAAVEQAVAEHAAAGLVVEIVETGRTFRGVMA